MLLAKRVRSARKTESSLREREGTLEGSLRERVRLERVRLERERERERERESSLQNSFEREFAPREREMAHRGEHAEGCHSQTNSKRVWPYTISYTYISKQ